MAETRFSKPKAGDSVFVSVPSDLGLDFTNAAINVIRDLGLVPNVFQGVTVPPVGMTSTTYVEARAAMTESSVICVLLPPARAATDERDWAHELLSEGSARGAGPLVYDVPKGGVAPTGGGAPPPLPIPPGAAIHSVADALQFAAALREDLHT